MSPAFGDVQRGSRTIPLVDVERILESIIGLDWRFCKFLVTAILYHFWMLMSDSQSCYLDWYLLVFYYGVIQRALIWRLKKYGLRALAAALLVE